ncbi:MAG: hypothetical protein LAO23_14695 [Acidobacteriia bacterium]|nr:hypothetical protein [Terriglobia bacterium]
MPKRQPLEIRCDENGFVVTASGSREPNASLAWDEVDTVLAYKRDLYTVDLICLGFVTPERTIEVHEEMQGWSQLVEQLPSRLRGMPPFSGWWESVAKPPFAPSVTTLYKRG